MATRLKPIPLALLALSLPVCAQAAPADDPLELAPVTVTGTREGRTIAETPATVNVIKADSIAAQKPQHASQIMNQAAGVWVNVTGGEGHVTAIRQPLTTNPVYLYLEDGVPTRSTGFFNHNALYEINLPQSGGVEINKGPGTALYGSDAIGGVINVLTRAPSLKPSAEASIEAGQFGWTRGLFSLSGSQGNDGVRGDLNLTHTGGWRDATGYDRQSASLRWDHAIGANALLKTVLTASNIDQDTAGSSTISRDDYQHNPTVNYTPISFRKVQALRLSSAYEQEDGARLVSVTPYLRYDSMDLLANWSLGYDPSVYNTSNRSFGVLTKVRQDFAPLRARLIAGVDIDYSPGSREENAIGTGKEGSGYTTRYTSYVSGDRVYDYDATFRAISPYLHAEISPAERLRLTGGLRFDHMHYSYDNSLSDGVLASGGRFYYRPADTSTTYRHWSPKLGATYDLGGQQSLFAAYNHAFRAPSEGQLFRPGASGSAAGLAVNTTDLKPIKVNSYELGYRGNAGKSLGYSLSAYRMDKRDDILSYKDPVTNATQSVNAGRTLHRGIEAGANAGLYPGLELGLSYGYAIHSYRQWQVNGATDYSGKEMETAPRQIGNTRLSYAPAGNKGWQATAEWVHLGSYWLDQANTQKYSGHDLLNLRGNLPLAAEWSLFASLNNVTDRRYAESASLSSGNDVYAPGMPRTAYLGIEYKSK
ncbi:MAG: TonB-dependent receptor [Chitinivorax sp.]